MPADLFTPESLVAFLTLLALEIVLGIDNVIFIAILTGKLPPERRASARTTGISLAVITRILLLFSVSWIMGLTATLVPVPGSHAGLSGRDLILLAGGLFLIASEVPGRALTLPFLISMAALSVAISAWPASSAASCAA